MRTLISVFASLLLTATAAAETCIWESAEGGQLQVVHLDDYNYAYQGPGRKGTLCLIYRNLETADLACDDGVNGPLEYGKGASGQEVRRFDGQEFKARCE